MAAVKPFLCIRPAEAMVSRVAVGMILSNINTFDILIIRKLYDIVSSFHDICTI